MLLRDPRRRLRAALLGSALAVLSLAGHTAAGGGADGVGVALVLLLSLALGTAMSAGRAKPVIVLGVLVGGQALLHTVLTFAAGHAHGPVAAAPSASTMVLAHAVAAVVATTLVVHADRIAEAWAGFLSSLLGAQRPTAAPLPRCVGARVRTGASGARVSDFVSGLLVRRGPPAGIPALCA